MPQKILVVDNEPADLRRLERLFGPTCQVLCAASGEEALRLLEQHDVALLIITELRLPGTTGAALLEQAAALRPHMLRIILTAHPDAEALADSINRGQVYRYATKPCDDEDIRLTVARALQHYEAARSRHEAEETNKRLARRLRAMTRGVIRAIADTLEAKDRYVYGHTRRVGGYASAIGRRMRLGVPVLEQISLAALLHDVGKISTPDSILLKPDVLSEQERAVVRLHSARGARLLAVCHSAAACAAFLLAITFACRGAAASVTATPRAISDGDARRAEKVLAKLGLLYEAAGADDARAYCSLASKLYPDLFVRVAEIRAGDLSTDLATAVFLAEKLGRTWVAAGEAKADCEGERPDIYRPLCLSLRGGTVRQLLLAKSRLHARWATAVLRDARGGADAETARALEEMRAARINDYLIAARVVETLRPLQGLPGQSAADAGRGGRLATTAGGSDRSDEDFTDALHAAGALLAWLPRSQTFYRLSAAQQAYADGLSWYQKARQSKRPVVSANSFAPDPLKVLGLDAEHAVAAAHANWKSAAKLTRFTEQSLSAAAR